MIRNLPTFEDHLSLLFSLTQPITPPFLLHSTPPTGRNAAVSIESLFSMLLPTLLDSSSLPSG